MIVIDLCCEHQHAFEAWFASSEAYQTQRSRQLVECPQCGSAQIERLPSAPALCLGPRAAAPQEASPSPQQQIRAALRKLARDAEDVGSRFAEEARRIHYGEIPARQIRGEAKAAEFIELIEEGVAVLPLPAVAEDLH